MKYLLFVLPIICLNFHLQAQNASIVDSHRQTTITEENFFDAVRDRDTHTVIYFLDIGFMDGRGVDDINTVNELGQTALHIAAENADKNMIEVLWDRGAKVIRDKDGNTPLHMLILGAMPMFDGMVAIKESLNSSDFILIGEFLLARGAAPQDVNTYGETPLSLAIQIIDSLPFNHVGPRSLNVKVSDPTEELLRLLLTINTTRQIALRISLLEQIEQELSERQVERIVESIVNGDFPKEITSKESLLKYATSSSDNDEMIEQVIVNGHMQARGELSR